MSNKEVQVTMDMILKMTPEMFLDFVRTQPMGFNLSLRNLLKAQYEQCNMAKEGLASILIKEEKISDKDIKEINKTIKDLYLSMQLIEDRHALVDLYIQGVN